MSASGPFRARELTPHGAGGVAVIALEGPGALARLERIAPGQRVARGRPVLVRLAHAGENLDRAIVWVEGDERVEVHVHASPPLVRRVLELVGGTAGEPESEALEARARRMLASAACEAAARILLDQEEGALRRELASILAGGRAGAKLALAELSSRARIARRAIEPALVAITGPVNAGKSTLFNALCGRERAIVSPAAGTTRDVVVERVSFGAYAVDLADTAGERELAAAARAPDADLERGGIERGARVRQRAALVLWLDPLDAPAAPPALGVACARIVSRADVAAPAAKAGERAPRISALRDPHGACAVVHAVFRESLDLPAEPWRPGEGVAFDDRSRQAVEIALARAAGRAPGDWRAPLSAAADER